MPGTVTVACKLPNGLHLDDMNKQGIRTRWASLIGPALPFGVFSPDVQHGVGLTHGVDADKFAAWMAEHREYAPVKAGLIYAHTKPEEVVAKAKDLVGQRSGFEPLSAADQPLELEAA